MFLFCFFIFDLTVLSWTQVSFVHNQNEYVINNKTVNYSSARNACESINSTLVDIIDGNKNTLVDKIRDIFTEPVTCFWIKSANLSEKVQFMYLNESLLPNRFKISANVPYCPVLEVRFGSKNINEKWLTIPCDISSNEIENSPRFICQKPAPLKITSTIQNEETSTTTMRSTATSDIIDSETTFSNPGYFAIVIAISTVFVLIFLLVLSLIYVYFKLIKFKHKTKTENIQLQEKKTDLSLMYAKVIKKPKQTDQLQTNNDTVEEDNELYSVTHDVDAKTCDENIYNVPSA